jgi:BMFP domain-containing protein YqiC
VIVTEYIWETFDGLFKTVHRQERRVATLEQRIADLERRLQQQAADTERAAESSVTEFPAERAA